MRPASMQAQGEATVVESQASGTVRNAGALGALIALGASAAFAIAAGGAGPVARYGGAVWVLILTWIILMPVLAPWLKQRRQA